jgi:cation transport ATPase
MNASLLKFKWALPLAFVSLSIPAAQSETLVATVNGMVCAFCAQGIDRKLRAIEATQDVYVNLSQKIVAVEMKEGKKIDDAQFRRIVTEAGFEVKASRTVPQTAAQIKAETKSKSS